MHGTCIDQITFQNEYLDDEFETITLYFEVPEKLFCNENGILAIDFPIEHMEARYASVTYETVDIDLPYEDIEKLMDIYEKNKKEKTK